MVLAALLEWHGCLRLGELMSDGLEIAAAAPSLLKASLARSGKWATGVAFFGGVTSDILNPLAPFAAYIALVAAVAAVIIAIAIVLRLLLVEKALPALVFASTAAAIAGGIFAVQQADRCQGRRHRQAGAGHHQAAGIGRHRRGAGREDRNDRDRNAERRSTRSRRRRRRSKPRPKRSPRDRPSRAPRPTGCRRPPRTLPRRPKRSRRRPTRSPNRTRRSPRTRKSSSRPTEQLAAKTDDISKQTETVVANQEKQQAQAEKLQATTEKIADSIETIASGFEKLAQQGGIIADPQRPDEFYHNARLHELSGDMLNARRAYLAFAGFDVDAVDPYPRFATLLRVQDGKAGAREVFGALAEKGKAPSLKLVHLLQFDDQQRLDKLNAFIAANPDYGPAYYLLAQEFSEDRLGVQTLADKRSGGDGARPSS